MNQDRRGISFPTLEHFLEEGLARDPARHGRHDCDGVFGPG